MHHLPVVNQSQASEATIILHKHSYIHIEQWFKWFNMDQIYLYLSCLSCVTWSDICCDDRVLYYALLCILHSIFCGLASHTVACHWCRLQAGSLHKQTWLRVNVTQRGEHGLGMKSPNTDQKILTILCKLCCRPVLKASSHTTDLIYHLERVYRGYFGWTRHLGNYHEDWRR